MTPVRAVLNDLFLHKTNAKAVHEATILRTQPVSHPSRKLFSCESQVSTPCHLIPPRFWARTLLEGRGGLLVIKPWAVSRTVHTSWV